MSDVPQGKRTVSDDEIVREMRERPDPAFTTAELADVFDLSTEGMRNRLEEIHEEGVIGRKKPTSRTVLWWAGVDTGQLAFSA